MIGGYSFDEFYASEVLPMSHGLLEQRLMRSAEMLIDFVRYDSVIPNPLFSSGRRSFLPGAVGVARQFFGDHDDRTVFHFIRKIRLGALELGAVVVHDFILIRDVLFRYEEFVDVLVTSIRVGYS